MLELKFQNLPENKPIATQKNRVFKGKTRGASPHSGTDFSSKIESCFLCHRICWRVSTAICGAIFSQELIVPVMANAELYRID